MGEESMKALASQLRHPQGKHGREVGDMMHESNIGMTRHSIACLELAPGDRILELGHGNGGHIAGLFQDHRQITYHGLDISTLMHDEAVRINQPLVDSRQARFYLYDGQQIPFADHHFDKIFTVNTIYFWDDPAGMLAGLYRVLRPGGRLCITFGQREFMERLPFTQYGFALYDNRLIQQLVEQTSFESIDFDTQTEVVRNKAGEAVEREFTTVILGK